MKTLLMKDFASANQRLNYNDDDIIILDDDDIKNGTFFWDGQIIDMTIAQLNITEENTRYYLVTPQSGYYTHQYRDIGQEEYNRLFKLWDNSKDNPDIDGEYILDTSFDYDENGQII